MLTLSNLKIKRINNNMYNYEMTEKSEIYKGVYWGRFKYNEENEEIIENRNRFIKDWEISKSLNIGEIPKYVLLY